MFKDNPRYREVGDGQYEDLETGDMIIEVDDSVGKMLNDAFGIEPDEDGTYRLTEDAFNVIFADALDEIYSDESDLNDL